MAWVWYVYLHPSLLTSQPCLRKEKVQQTLAELLFVILTNQQKQDYHHFNTPKAATNIAGPAEWKDFFLQSGWPRFCQDINECHTVCSSTSLAPHSTMLCLISSIPLCSTWPTSFETACHGLTKIWPPLSFCNPLSHPSGRPAFLFLPLWSFPLLFPLPLPFFSLLFFSLPLPLLPLEASSPSPHWGQGQTKHNKHETEMPVHGYW